MHAQLRVASGEPLPWRQDELTQRGHAIECRVYAEDPSAGFLPQAGTLLRYREPAGPGIRVDAGYREGSDVSVYYDPMLAKLIVWGETREAAIARATAALEQFVVLGIRTNIAFLATVLNHPRFRAADIDTRFLDTDADALRAIMERDEFPRAALVAAVLHQEQGARAAGGAVGHSSAAEPFTSLGAWRG